MGTENAKLPKNFVLKHDYYAEATMEGKADVTHAGAGRQHGAHTHAPLFDEVETIVSLGVVH